MLSTRLEPEVVRHHHLFILCITLSVSASTLELTSSRSKIPHGLPLFSSLRVLPPVWHLLDFTRVLNTALARLNSCFCPWLKTSSHSASSAPSYGSRFSRNELPSGSKKGRNSDETRSRGGTVDQTQWQAIDGEGVIG